MQKEIIFVCSILFFLFLYRSIVSLQIVRKKKFIIEEQSYVLFAYLTLTCLLIILTKNIVIGIIFLALTPVVMVTYFLLMKIRIYWIVNGAETSLASYGNALIDKIPIFKNSTYMKEHIIFRKVDRKIKVNIENLNYEEKEQILKVLNEVAKEHTKEVNGWQIIFLILNLIVCFLTLFAILLVI